MQTDTPRPEIVEAAVEHRVDYASHWLDRWTIPNPFITLLQDVLKEWEVSLSEYSFRQDAKTVGDTALVINVPKLRSTIIIGLDKLIFRTLNPDWEMAQDLVTVFDRCVEAFNNFVKVGVREQECTLVFHVTPGTVDISAQTVRLVNSQIVGEAVFYGISKYTEDSTLLLERSLKFEGGAFFRLTRKFPSSSKFADVALAILQDEQTALSLIGLEELVA